MNPMIKRWTASTLALAMAVSMGVCASAKPTSSRTLLKPAAGTTTTTTSTNAPAVAPVTISANDYSVNVTTNTVQFVRNGKVVTSYQAKLAGNTNKVDVTVLQNSKGNFCVSFTKSDGKGISVNLGSQSDIAFSGNYNTLTFDTTVPVGHDFVVGGTVTTLNVNSPSVVTISAEASINSLKVGNKDAAVNVVSGAKVAAGATVSGAVVTGLNNLGSMSSAAVSSTTNKAGYSSPDGTVGNTTSGGLFLEMKDASDTKKYASSISYNSDNSIVIVPKKNNVSLGSLMQDIKLIVRKADTNTMLTGEWNFVKGATESTKASPGTYKYQFTPHQAYKGFDVTIKIQEAGSAAASTVTTSPKIAFYSGVGRGAGGKVDVDVTLPAGVTRGDVLELHAGTWSTTKDLVNSDGGATRTYTVEIDPDEMTTSRTKVYAVLRTNGKTLTSNTINYTYDEDGDTGSLKKPGLSISPSHGDGSFVASVSLPSSVKKNDEVVIYATKKGSSNREVGSADLSDNDAGKTIKINCEVSGSDDDEFKIRATLRSGGQSASSETKTYRIAD